MDMLSRALQEKRIDFRWDAIHEENKLMTEYRVTSAESLYSKIKDFRAQLRGVSDVKYFLFRLQNIYA